MCVRWRGHKHIKYIWFVCKCLYLKIISFSLVSLTESVSTNIRFHKFFLFFHLRDLMSFLFFFASFLWHWILLSILQDDLLDWEKRKDTFFFWSVCVSSHVCPILLDTFVWFLLCSSPTIIASSPPFLSCPKVHCFRSPLSPKKRVIWDSHVSWCFMFYHLFFFSLILMFLCLVELWPFVCFNLYMSSWVAW